MVIGSYPFGFFGLYIELGASSYQNDPRCARVSLRRESIASVDVSL